MPRADTTGQPWRQRLAVIAAENRALFEAHPWTAAISTIRPPLGPGLMAKYEHELSALDGLGLEHAYQFGLRVILDGLAAQLPGPRRSARRSGGI